jgi:hypothetical protein
VIARLRTVYEVLGGFRPLPEAAPLWVELLLPLWWCALIAAALAFGGVGVKFAYIDF